MFDNTEKMDKLKKYLMQALQVLKSVMENPLKQDI
jgi:hypothetical protein